ncbi:MAG: DUF3341 domain-containing protein [Candidatus Krumholzibacteriia bacterium]
MTYDDRFHGLLVEFDDPVALEAACVQVRDAGYRDWDAHTPFPVHGMDAAMGIRGTRLPLIVLGGGLTGMTLALLMIWWMNAVDYPFIISGKPLFGWPAAVPVTFELTVLFSAFATFFGMWGLNGMPRLSHPLFSNERFRRATSDRFFIVIEKTDPKFDLARTKTFLEGLGGLAVDEVHDQAED